MMGEKEFCQVHEGKNANNCHNYSAKKAVRLGHPELTVNPDCSCNVGETGPVTTGGNVATGPAKE